MSATFAVIFVPVIPGADVFVLQCIAHVEARGYQLYAIARTWAQVNEVIHERLAQVVVMARREHMPPDRVPRFEFLGVEPGDSRPQPVLRAEVAGRGRRPRAVS